jgi:hypothetical protein
MFGPDFEKHRIFNTNDFQLERKGSALLRNVFETLEEKGI